MKTKIIYISGDEVFDVSDIRAAFEEVRNTLGFGTDTVLFGVPVDSDDAGLHIEQKPQNVKKTKTTEPVENITIRSAETKKTDSKPEEKIEETPDTSEKIIPILSVLSGDKGLEEIEEESDSEIYDTDIETPIEETVTLKKIKIEDAPKEHKETKIIKTETVKIEEIMTDDFPTEQETLEQLFERIAPLRETEENIHAQEEEPEVTVEELNLDTTLEQLANEFAEKEDDIVETPKASASGKIGKLKNILPFKKAKREEPSLMGDLFGWAGIAANDDEFSIPGFFTTSASKK